MREVKASVIILDNTGRILLQLRDEEPEKGKWVLFGGSVEVNETEEEAVKREIKEELGYQIKNIHFFKRYEYKGVEQPIFEVEEPVLLENISLHEGGRMKFFNPEEINDIGIGFNYKRIILDFLEYKKRRA